MGKLLILVLSQLSLGWFLAGCGSGFSDAALQNPCSSGSVSQTNCLYTSASNSAAAISFFISNSTMSKKPLLLTPNSLPPTVTNTTAYTNFSIITSGYGAGGYTPTSVKALLQYQQASNLIPLAQKMSVTGTCSTGGAAYNMITYTVSKTSGQVLPTDIYGVNYVTSPSQLVNPNNPGQCPNSNSGAVNCLRTSLCENGKFSLTVTPPADTDSTTSCLSCYVGTNPSQSTYQLNVQIWTGTSLQNLNAGPFFTGNFIVQN